MMLRNNNICNNCGKQGHQFHQCKMPIISYGTIAFRHSPRGIEYLMIMRKNSFGYIDFIRGKYLLTDLDHLHIMFDEMSMEEKLDIINKDFNTLWTNMWGNEHCNNHQYKTEEAASHKKFNVLKNGIPIGPYSEIVDFTYLINNSKTNWIDTEWEFPKGRRNYQENNLECALREFEEETGLSKDCVHIIENLMPIEEIFLGSNHKSYKHKFFLGHVEYTDTTLNNYQYSEVSKLCWKTYDECIQSIRPYNLEKKQLITNIHSVLQEYRIC